MSEAASLATASANSRRERAAWWIFAAVFAAMIAWYWPMFFVKPAGDDFGAPLLEIASARVHGPSYFYSHSGHGISYRPTQALLMWLFASIQPQHEIFWIHVLDAVSMGLFVVSALLWAKAMPLQPVGQLVTACVLCFHPTLVIAIGSVDTFGTPLCSGLIWLGAYFVFRYRERPGVACALSLVCFLAGVGVKEFAFSLVPLGGLVMLFFASQKRFLRALTAMAPTAIGAVAYLAVRKQVLPPATASIELPISAKLLVYNAALYISGLLFTGNSVWVFVHQSKPVLLVAAACMLVVAALLMTGLAIRLRQAEAGADSEWAASQFPVRRWVLFLLLGMLVVTFPACIARRTSELYLTPLFLPLALLAGLAADGLRAGPRPLTWFAAAAGVILLTVALFAIRAKVAGLYEVGEKADLVLRSALQSVPEEQTTGKVALLFLNSDEPPRPSYSVYRMAHCAVLMEGAAQWIRPGSNVMLESIPIDRMDDFTDKDHYDLTLLWNNKAQRFERLTAP